MYTTTQIEKKLFDFDNYIDKCFRDLIGASDDLLVQNTIQLICITSGLELQLVMNMKWKQILSLGSENDAVVNDELFLRKYIIPIHPKVKLCLSEIYGRLGFPDEESLIIEKYANKRYHTDLQSIVRIMYKGGVFSNYDYLYKNINYNVFFQVVFGRKVLEVNGYSDEVIKKLKQHFKIKLNNELFDFLGFNSKDEIDFKLSSIKLHNNKIIYENGKDVLKVTDSYIQLKDKNFNTKYQFQKFSAFSSFLINANSFYRRPITNSIRILLLMSLYNGIRLSTLICLKWIDIVDVNEINNTIKMKKQCLFNNFEINIGVEVEDKLLYHLELSIQRTSKKEIVFYESDTIKYDEKPNLDTFVFVTNLDNQLTQPSLSREIKKALTYLKFPHVNKFHPNSTLIMYGRKIIEIKGDHLQTIQALKKHYNFKSKYKLFEFLKIDNDKKRKQYEFKGKRRNPLFEEIFYDH